MSGSGYLKFRNDRGVPEICIGVREFKCMGVSPPQDHPRIYINMGEADMILCAYCGTRFRFDPRLTPFYADPPDSLLTKTRPGRSRGVVAPDRSCPHLASRSVVKRRRMIHQTAASIAASPPPV